MLTENTAQAVLKHLKDLESNRKNVLTRWVWELLQNARDASRNTHTELIASVEYTDGEIVFQHNGGKFKDEEVAHLIYHGSTKTEDEVTIGQYGSGFLTTHLLSPSIDISGYLSYDQTDDQPFTFRLTRKIDSVESLHKSMEEAWEDFNASVDSLPTLHLNGFTTKFRYPITGDANDVVNEGIKTLKRCAPYVVVFNKEFSGINIKTPSEETSFKVKQRLPYSVGNASEITVTETSNVQSTTRKYLLIENEDGSASVCTPFEYNDSSYGCTSIADVPKLFLGFPLMGTENFSFPAVVNSLKFAPTENRDGVRLWLSSDNEANLTNQGIIEEACELLVELIDSVASQEWHDIHMLATIPPVRDQAWFNSDSLRTFLSEYFIDAIRQKSVVLCENARTLSKIEDAIIPYADKCEDILSLWDLLNEVQDFRQKLPRHKEAIGWRDAVESWISIHTDDDVSFSEKFDCRRLAEHVEKEGRSIRTLGTLLQHSDEDSTIKWLDRLHKVLKSTDNEDLVKESNLIPDQEGFFNTLDGLYRDKDVSPELKDIAELIDLNVRQELRDTRLNSLVNENGAGDYENSNLIREIKAELRKLADRDDLNDGFMSASVKLFGWLVRNQQWDYIDNFLAFSEEGSGGSREVIKLTRDNNVDRPLAPVGAWGQGLSEFSDLFPPVHIVADAFFDELSDPEAWSKLAEKGFVRTNVVFPKNEIVNFKEFLPHEPLPDGEHKTVNPVSVTDIAFFNESEIGTIDRVRRNQTRARLLWKFLTQWLISHDPQGLEIKEAKCECEENQKHRYSPAAWLIPLVERSWIPLGRNMSDDANPKSLAKLTRSVDADSDSSQWHSDETKLLEAMGIRVAELWLEGFLGDDEATRPEREAKLKDILDVVENTDLNPEHMREFADHMKDDPKSLEYLEERREQRRIVRENQELGKQVEQLVRESIEDEGFTVKRTGKGSDFEIWLDTNDHATTLEVFRKNQSWLVEVKATRTSTVSMSRTQAEKAVDKGNDFLLCVVPVEKEGSLLEIEDVQSEMRFVQNIGPRLGTVCENLDGLDQISADVRNKFIKDSGTDLELEIQQGSVRVRVKHSLWNEGFQIDNLASNLTNTNP